MSNALYRAIAGRTAASARNDVTADGLIASGGISLAGIGSGEDNARKLSTVDRCLEILSDSIGKLPVYVMDSATRERVRDHYLSELLTVRPNAVQPPTLAKKMIEANRAGSGNGYALILRDPKTLRPAQLIPVPHGLVQPQMMSDGALRYRVTHPFTGKMLPKVAASDMIHVRGYSHNGYTGISVLERAAETIAAARAAQLYNGSYYANGGQPGGVLSTDTDLSGTVEIVRNGEIVKINKKDAIRAEWEKRHGGPGNVGRVAVLDYGLKYTPISISNRDAQFVEQNALNVEDIARFFGVPLYKLQAGKQSYSSNEQNAIEYVVSTLHPIVTQYEEELTYKLLTSSEIDNGLRIRVNMMAELRGDFAARGAWYKAMNEIGGYSVNDIRALEDLPDVDGGDEHNASLNYVPLSLWREMSIKRNSNGGKS